MIDLKLIFRDPSLRIFLAMPLIILLVVLVALPMLVDSYEGVQRFVPIVLMGATIQTSTMFAFIYGMVLIHEKDIQVSKIYGILPVSKTGFVTTRLVFPFAISSMATFILLFTQPFYSFSILSMLLLAILCGSVAPIMTLLVSIISKNKMEGLTWFKLINLILTIPLVAFFISKFGALFGVIPSYWAFEMLDKMIGNEPYLLPFFIGLAFSILLLLLCVKRFSKVHFL